MTTEKTTPPAIQIGADGIDVHALEEQILDTVAEKRARGVYDDDVVARAERNNLLLLQDDAQFMEQYLTCLRQIVPVENQTNGVLLAAVEIMNRKHKAEISELHERIEALEKLVKG